MLQPFKKSLRIYVKKLHTQQCAGSVYKTPAFLILSGEKQIKTAIKSTRNGVNFN